MAIDALVNLPKTQDVLIDANVFIYAFVNHSHQCRAFLERCAREDVFGITTVEIVSEVCHRLMLAEALDKGLITKSSANQLKTRLNSIKNLSGYWQETSRIFAINILILGLNESRLHRAHAIRSGHGMLTNDSIIAAAAQEYGINCIATNDTDFDHLPFITCFKPNDI